MTRVIVKVQLPTATNLESPQALVYDQGRTIELMLPVTPKLVSRLKGKPKSFWYAWIAKTGSGGAVTLLGPAPWQEW